MKTSVTGVALVSFALLHLELKWDLMFRSMAQLFLANKGSILFVVDVAGAEHILGRGASRYTTRCSGTSGHIWGPRLACWEKGYGSWLASRGEPLSQLHICAWKYCSKL